MTSDATDVEEHEGRPESNVLDEEVHSSPRSWNASFQQQPHHSSSNAAVDSCDAGDISDNHENSPDHSEVEPDEPIDLRHPQLVLDRMFKMEGQCTDSSSDSEESNEEQALQKEVVQYISEKASDKDTEPLQLWKNNMHRLPRLAKLAKRFFSIPATSTPSERLFSAAGAIVTRKCDGLSPSHVDMLVLLHSNLA
ncbi:UNVERIFIED_CONTAM: hypothetical protein FKN15_041901 [Acipenser sinensis]